MYKTQTYTCFLWFTGTLHKRNGFYTVCVISTFPTENSLCMIYKQFVIIHICYLMNHITWAQRTKKLPPEVSVTILKSVSHRRSLLKGYQSIVNAKLTGRKKFDRKRCTSNRDDYKLDNTVNQSRFKHLGELHRE